LFAFVVVEENSIPLHLGINVESSLYGWEKYYNVENFLMNINAKGKQKRRFELEYFPWRGGFFGAAANFRIGLHGILLELLD
jgi:hypothetical protein